ncbi:hypothetical protein LAUMK35_05800 [Mycobacterium pseudokansasii]|jgi:hypothetical protein|nr:hypothetical protein LAUMK35_05800 [Mycobacterium pseudokansasii]VBA36095.1 hypothetical protein LAUMK21_05779 [Mycobacterium pseudokansasii]
MTVTEPVLRVVVRELVCTMSIRYTDGSADA